MKKCLVITGGSGGIGSATISKFQAEGWNVIDISLKPTSRKNITTIDCDFLHPEKIKELTDDLKKYLQNVTSIALVHCAGFQIDDNIQNITQENLLKTFNVNVFAASELNKILIPLMGKGSSIIYIGSMLADRGVPNAASYSISKHAVIGLMRSTCQDLVGLPISTCCINPGLVETPMLHEHMPKELISQLLNNFIIGKRTIAPEEIAELIFNCSQTPIVNGTVIAANTGLVAAS